MKALRTTRPLRWAILLIPTLFLALAAFAGNDVMGEIQFEGKSKVEKTSGVWVDGQYVGFLKELKGSKQVMLLPGEHEIVVRQDGYRDFRDTVLVQPGQRHVVFVRMKRSLRASLPDVTATVKIDVDPERAAVFVDGLFAGHVGEFKGAGRAMLIAPGTHQIRIALPGYQTFETDINPLANQKVQIKTELVRNGAPLAEPLITTETSENTTAPVARGTQTARVNPKK